MLSSSSARVTFAKYDATLETATGFIGVPASVLSKVYGAPSLSVVQASTPQLSAMQVTKMALVQGGFIFTAKWPSALPHGALGISKSSVSMTIRATLSLACPSTVSVDALTNVHLYADAQHEWWASSGDACSVCQQWFD